MPATPAQQMVTPAKAAKTWGGDSSLKNVCVALRGMGSRYLLPRSLDRRNPHYEHQIFEMRESNI